MAVVMFDIDGCLADFAYAFTRQARIEGYEGETFDTLTNQKWSWMDHRQGFDPGPIPPKIQDKIWDFIRASDDFWVHIPTLLDRATWAQISQATDEHDVYFVTSRPGSGTKTQTEQWLSFFLGHVPAVIIGARKAEIASGLKADFSLEDKAGNAVAISWGARNCKSYILNRLYNQFDPDVLGSKVKRVHSVSEFLKAVNA